jgi:plastocyanin
LNFTSLGVTSASTNADCPSLRSEDIMTIPHRSLSFAWVTLLFCFAPSAPAAEPATQPSGTITGMVISQGEVPLSEMVIYLESPDAKRQIAVPKETVKVSQKGAKFSPAIVIVCAGQTVDFLNDEDRPIEHNVFSNTPAKRFDLGLYKPGEARSVVFDKPGAIFLFCSIHRHMDGVVFVSPTPFTSRVEPDGKFKIENVPPGIWNVKTWQKRKRFPEQTVPVLLEAAKPATVDLELRKK